jgi:hypothetical protein
LIEFFEDGRLELYNLRTDEAEQHNVADKHPQLRDKLHRQLVEWRQRLQVQMPQPRPAK